jgi:ribosomal protein S14
MKYLKIKDLENRSKYKDKELKIVTLKFIKNYLRAEKNEELQTAKANLILLQRKTNKEKNKILRRCSIVNRNKVSISKFGISRTKLKEIILLGMVTGYQKAVW